MAIVHVLRSTEKSNAWTARTLRTFHGGNRICPMLKISVKYFTTCRQAMNHTPDGIIGLA